MKAMKSLLLCALSAGLLYAQTAKTADSLPGVDLSGLSAAQKGTAVKILQDRDCPCGCSMKVATCRQADPSCSYSAGMADVVVTAVKQGKTEQQARAEADASKWAHVQPPKVLEDPVSIPVAGAPVTGPQNAAVTLVEFSDFQCPYCAAAVPQIHAVLKAYPTQVKLIFKQFPLETHPQADLAATAALAAQKQGKFWEMHDAMYQSQDDLSRRSILALAARIGLDIKRMEEDMDSTAIRETVVRDVQDGDKAGVQGTPTIFINGQKYNGAINLSIMKPVLDVALKQSRSKEQAGLKLP
jgi:protein-disulfide isomerase